MAIEKKLIHFGKLADFEAQLTAGNILDYSIVFIQDAKKIWTHGTYYDCSEGTATGDIVQSDWNESDSASDAFVKNRTHYANFTEFEIPSTITNSTDTFISYPGTIGKAIYVRYICDTHSVDVSLKIDANDNDAHQLGFGPVFTIRKGFNGVYVSGDYEASQKLYLATDVLQLGDIYIPDTIVRADGVKTVNGQSLIGDGNVELALGDDNVQSDWNVSDTSSDAYVKNRTHYYQIQGAESSVSVSAATIGTNLFMVYPDVGFLFNGHPYSTKECLGQSVKLTGSGPTLYFTVVQEGDSYYVRHESGSTGWTISYASRVLVVPVSSAYIPETIARTSELKTINGQSILGSGDLTIEGGAKIYELNLTDRGNFEGYITEEEWNIIKDSDRIKIITNTFSTEIVQLHSPWLNLFYDDAALFGSVVSVQGGAVTQYLFTGANTTEFPPYSYMINEVFIPTKNSELENDSNFVTSEGLKTINGESIVGSGDIAISGGGGSSSGSGAYSEVNHGTSDTTFTLTPNTFHVWDEVANLTLTLGSETSGVANEFLFQFTSGTTATTLTLPSDLKWANDTPPAIIENMIYQISVLKGLATALEFNSINYIRFTIDGDETIAEEGMTWVDWVSTDYNKKGLYLSGGYVRGFQTIVMIGDNYVRDADSIIPNGAYVLYDSSGSN